MAKLKVYVDTSVFGALYDKEDTRRVEITENMLDILRLRIGCIPFISNIVLDEIDAAPERIRSDLKKRVKVADPRVLQETSACVALVAEYMKRRIIPAQSRDDARHIAVATVHQVDAIITWNCRHMANIEKKVAINEVNLKSGWGHVDIITPLEVVEHD